MLAFVFFVAVTNLAVGYVLGGGEIPAFLSKLPFLSKKPQPEEIDVEDSLTKPVNVEASTPEPVPQLEIPIEVSEALEQPIAELEDAAEETNETPSPEPTPVEIPDQEETPAPKKSKPSSQALLAGLSSLQEKLSAASDQLKDHQDSPNEFEVCANLLQEANHDYLKNAEGTVSQLTELSEDGDSAAGQACTAVAKGAEQAQAISEKIDTLLENTLDEDGRRSLVEHSTNIVSTVSRSCEKANDKLQEASEESESAEESDSIRNAESSAKELMSIIENAIDSIEDNNSLFIAEASLDPLSPEAPSGKIMDAISNDLGTVISGVINESQSYSCEGRRLIFLKGDSLEQAISRVEELRQSYEKTVYKNESDSVSGTLTCTISEIKKGTSSDEIDAILDRSAAESDSMGSNQTLHHDGAFATPINAVAHDLSPRIVNID